MKWFAITTILATLLIGSPVTAETEISQLRKQVAELQRQLESSENTVRTARKAFVRVQKELAEERRAVKNFIIHDPLLSRFVSNVFLFEDIPAADRKPALDWIDGWHTDSTGVKGLCPYKILESEMLCQSINKESRIYQELLEYCHNMNA